MKQAHLSEVITHLNGRIHRVIVGVDTHVALEHLPQLGTSKQLIDQPTIQRCLRDITIRTGSVLDHILRVVVYRPFRQASCCDDIIFVHSPELID